MKILIIEILLSLNLFFKVKYVNGIRIKKYTNVFKLNIISPLNIHLKILNQ